MKKNLILATVLTFLSFTAVAHAGSFADVPDNSEHFAAVEYLKSKGVISGYPDGTFQPDKNINRAEAIKILLLGTKTSLESTQQIAFPDVSESDWFFPYVRKAFEIKTVEGYPDGKFRPENTINLAESLKVILLSFQAQLPAVLTVDPYPDVAKGDWYAPFADYSRTKNVIAPQDDGKLHGESQMTRAEFAEIVYRLMYIQEKGLDSFPLSTDWPTYTHPTDHYLIQYPFSWLKMEAGNHVIFWKQDTLNDQVSFARIFPNSSTLYTVVDQNKDQLTLDQYLSKLQYDSTAVTQKSTLNGYPFASISIPANGLEDFYFQLPNKTVLIIYSQIGTGPLQPQLELEVRYIVGSIRYNETNPTTSSTSTTDDLLSEIRKNLLVQGKGKTMIDLLKDGIVIETDTVGIGTGPIDYYYSAQNDVTLKYERNSDTLLALKSGKTSAF